MMSEFNQALFAELLKKAQGQRSINCYAALAGVSAAHISRLIRKLLATPPEAHTIRKLADQALNGITYEELMKAAGHMTTACTPSGESLAALPPINLNAEAVASLLTLIKTKVLPLLRALELAEHGEKSPVVQAIDSMIQEPDWNAGQCIIFRHVVESLVLRQEELVPAPLHSIESLKERIRSLPAAERKRLMQAILEEYLE